VTSSDNARFRTSGIVAGVPVFAGTRVPLQAILTYLSADRGIEAFLADHPMVTREQLYVTLSRGIEELIVRRQRIVELAAQGHLDREAGPAAARDER
jgi:uncharacterized protein (DUF433 family)